MRKEFAGQVHSWLDRLDLAKIARDITLATVPILAAFQMLAFLAFLPTCLSGRADFRQLYTAGYMVRAGHSKDLYDYESQRRFQNAVVSVEEGALPFIRPPHEALLFVPFSFLGYRAAYLSFLAFNIVVLCLTVRMMRPQVAEIARCWKWLPALMFPAFLPICVALIQGQDSIVVLALLASAWIYLNKGEDFAAGLLVGLGAFKPQIVGPIALLFLVWRRWRFLTGWIISVGTALVISLIVIGPSRAIVFARSLLSVGAGGGFPLDIRLMANLRGLAVVLAQDYWPVVIVQIAIAVASLLTLFLVARHASQHTAGAAFLVSITASVVVSYYAFIHDICYVIIPVAILLNRLMADDGSDNRFRVAVCIASIILLVAPFSLFLAPSYFYLVSLPVLAFLVFQVRFYADAPLH